MLGFGRVMRSRWAAALRTISAERASSGRSWAVLLSWAMAVKRDSIVVSSVRLSLISSKQALRCSNSGELMSSRSLGSVRPW